MRRNHNARRWGRSAAALVLATTVGAALAQNRGGSAYDRLNDDELARQLAELGMKELLNELLRQSGGEGTPQQRRILAESKLSAYKRSPRAPEADKLLQDALDAYRGLAEGFQQTAPPMSDEQRGGEWIGYCKDLSRLAYIHDQILAKPRALRILYLHGSDDDRRALREHGRRAGEAAFRLGETLQTLGDEWSLKPILLVQYNQQLEQMQAENALRTGWAMFHYAVGLAGDDEPSARSNRRNALRMTIDSVRMFLPTHRRYPNAKWQCHLLSGMAHRELGEFEQALTHLQSASASDAPADIAVRSRFEIAKARIEQGADLAGKAERLRTDQDLSGARDLMVRARGLFEKGLTAVEDYRRQGTEAVEAGDLRQDRGVIDAFAALLRNHLYATWAAAERPQDPARAAELRRRAQQVLVAFFEEHKDNEPLIRYFSEVLAAKFAGAEEVDRLNSMILYAMASRARSQGTEEGRRRAVEFLDIIRQRDDEVSRELMPMVLWLSAQIENDLGQPLEAAQMFMQLAREYPDLDQSYSAALNACIILNTLADEKGDSLRPEFRAKLVSAIELLLVEGPDAWAEKPQSKPWWFDLGWHRERLAKYRERQEGLVLLRQAAEAYAKVPGDTPQYLQARNRMLWVRIELLGYASEQQREQRVPELAEDLLAFSAEAARAAERADDPDRSKLIRNWGATAEFQGLRLRHEATGDAADLRRIEQLGEKWPGTNVLELAAEYRLEQLIGRGRIDSVINELRQFENRYGPRKARSLMGQLVVKIRERIREMSQEAGDGQRLEQYSKAYLEFARKLYEQAKAENADAQELYGLQYLLGEALIYAGKPEEAMRQYQALAERDERQRETKIGRIRSRYDDLLEDARRARGNVRATLDVLDEFVETVRASSLDVNRLASVQILLSARRSIEEARRSNREEAERLLRSLSAELPGAIESVRDRLIEQVPVDPTHVLGRARAHAAMGENEKALELYRDLVDGTSPESSPQLFWDVWVEYARTLMETRADDEQAMRRLAMNLKALRRRYTDMGGMVRQFVALTRRAEELSGTPDPQR